MSKYPYIPNKKMYAAVMGACRYIREEGYFNKAVSYYADRYGVDEEELAKHIRARQSAGQKGRKSASKGKKYKYFLVCQWCTCDADGTPYVTSPPQILKGLSEETVLTRFVDSDMNQTKAGDYGGNYVNVYHHAVIAEFNSKAEAEQNYPQWKDFAKQQGLEP